jgi:hypothetical protein
MGPQGLCRHTADRCFSASNPSFKFWFEEDSYEKENEKGLCSLEHSDFNVVMCIGMYQQGTRFGFANFGR